MKKSKPWFVYLLQCADGTFYTGITTDVKRRIEEHNGTAKGAKYTKARRPVKLFYQENQPNRSAAAKREYQLRRLSKQLKLSLRANDIRIKKNQTVL